MLVFYYDTPDIPGWKRRNLVEDVKDWRWVAVQVLCCFEVEVEQEDVLEDSDCVGRWSVGLQLRHAQADYQIVAEK